MNTPTEPEWWKLLPWDIKITLLASSWQAWTWWVIEHNKKKYCIGKDGSMVLAVNWWEIYANWHTVTKLIKDEVKKMNT